MYNLINSISVFKVNESIKFAQMFGAKCLALKTILVYIYFYVTFYNNILISSFIQRVYT